MLALVYSQGRGFSCMGCGRRSAHISAPGTDSQLFVHSFNLIEYGELVQRSTVGLTLRPAYHDRFCASCKFAGSISLALPEGSLACNLDIAL